MYQAQGNGQVYPQYPHSPYGQGQQMYESVDRLGVKMLTCNAEINILNRYTPPRIGLLCSNISLSSIIRGRYGKRLVKSIIGGSGGKEYLIRWRLSAIIAHGVIVHSAGYLRGCCLRHELSCAARDDHFYFFPYSCWYEFGCAFFFLSTARAGAQALEANGLRV